MKKKILSLIFIFVYCAEVFLNIAYASEDVFRGHAEKTDAAKSQSELFTGAVDKLNRNDVLKMTVSRVFDTSSAQEGDEFFAEVTNDVEGNGGIIIPCGTVAHGRIKHVAGSQRLGRDGSLDLDFDYLIIPDGREIPIKGRMSTNLHPVLATSKIIATDLGYTATGGALGGVVALSYFGLNAAVASQGTTIAGGVAVGGTLGLGMALYRKGKNVLISSGDEICVKINTSVPVAVYRKTALLQHELKKEGLDVNIEDINYEKDAYGEVSTITLTLTISNMTNLTFSIFDLALANDFNTVFYPSVFGDTKPMFNEIKPGESATGKISFSVDNVKHKLWLIFYDGKSRKAVAEISLNNAYRKISDKTKKQNEKFFKKKADFYREYNPLEDE